MNTKLFSLCAVAAPSVQTVILNLSCKENSVPEHLRVRKRLKLRFKRSLMRVLNFAKHETLRKLHRYLHSHRALQGQKHPGASKIAFNQDELVQDLQSLLYSEMPKMLSESASVTLPTQDMLDFISRREVLLSGLPEELYQRVLGEISTGLMSGESLADLSNRINQVFSDIEQGVAEVIADTETAAAFNYATDKAARAAGVQYKRWQHGGSKVPREDHLAIDGLVVPFDEPFPVGSPPLMFPHDPNGSPEDVINCSCVSIPASAEDYEG
jgi:hypothetical protein